MSVLKTERTAAVGEVDPVMEYLLPVDRSMMLPDGAAL